MIVYGQPALIPTANGALVGRAMATADDDADAAALLDARGR